MGSAQLMFTGLLLYIACKHSGKVDSIEAFIAFAMIIDIGITIGIFCKGG